MRKAVAVNAIAAVILLTVMSFAQPAVLLAASTPDQYQETIDPGGYSSGVNANVIAAQTFRAGRTGLLTSVSVYAWIAQDCSTIDIGSADPVCPELGPGDLVAQVRELDGWGRPTDVVLGEARVPQGSVGLGFTNGAWIDFTFTSPAQAFAGTTYALVLWS